MNKTEYLAARAVQKQAYKEHAEKIREARSQYNMEQKVLSSFPPGEPGTYAHIWHHEALSNLNESRTELQRLRTEATQMISEIHGLKEEAGRAWTPKENSMN